MTARYSGVTDEPVRDAWLYEAKPKPGCPNCAAEKARLAQAIKAGNASARFEAARNIRQCGHGDGGSRGLLEKWAQKAATLPRLLRWVLAVTATGGR